MDETWKDRVIQERNDLEGKIAKLREFINDPNPGVDISISQSLLLVEQLNIMRCYSNILERRIESFALAMKPEAIEKGVDQSGTK